MTLIHGVPTPMGNYTVTYIGDSTEKKNNKVFFKLNFEQTDTATGKITESFQVTPNAFLMKGEAWYPAFVQSRFKTLPYPRYFCIHHILAEP